MSFTRICLYCFLAALVACVPASATTPTHRRTASAHTKVAHRESVRYRRHRRHRVHGQQAIEPDRVTQIQQALIREHYMTGQPNGDWNAATQAAMQKYQADHGWQTKLMPDSRALKALGLGPDYSTAINAKDVASNGQTPAPAVPAAQAAGFAAASGVNR